MHFDPADGSTPTKAAVKTGSLATSPEKNPQREDFRFDGWTLDGQPYDFQTPVLRNITLKAQWSKITDWTLSPDHGPASGARLTISPPDKQEPRFSNIHAAGEQTVGLTGDGSIYAWTRESAPKQVPSPARAHQGFHYLQAAAGSGLQAALGSDQRIYAWTSQQATPTILNTDRNTGFTSISMNDDRLLAVDRQGYVHAYQAGSQDQTPEFTQQVRAGLPGHAQAVLAAASDKRILIVDADGQAWTWETSKIGKAEPSRIEREQGRRIIQAQALNKGFILQDADGHAWYLADSSTNPIAIRLQESMKARSITTNGSQAVITGTDGQVWVWKPGSKPVRADDGSQAYMQAAEAAGRITAISRQGSLYQWSPDAQGKPGKPSKLDTSTAPTLESASLDGQTLTLTKTGDAWQADMPARKPGQTAITLAGRQDSQPFTKNLNYTVDQDLTRDMKTETRYTVRFDTDGGNPKPGEQSVSTPYGRVKRPSSDPVRQGYLFDGWFTGQVAYDFSKPVTQNLTLTAHWTPESRNNTWSINPDKGSQLGNETTIITPPDTSRGIRFNQTSGGKNTTYGFSLAVGSNGNAYAWGYNDYGQLGNGTTSYNALRTPVVVKKPAGASADFTYVQVSAGAEHSLAVGSDGYVYAWGSNSYGQLGNSITSNNDANPVPARVRDPNSPTNENKGLKAIQVSADSSHSLALGSDGNAYAWGSNSYGQLGDGTTGNSRTTPVMVKKPTGTPSDFTYVQVSAGSNYSLALGSDGYAYAWGNNPYGQLGNNTETDSSVPVRVRDPDSPTNENNGLKAIQVSAGSSHSLALGSDGNAYAWGWNNYGQLGDGTTTDRSTPVAVRKPAGTPIDLTYLQVSAGYQHSLAVGSDGYAYAWGWNYYGQLGSNTSSTDANPVPVRVHDPVNPKNGSKGLLATQVSAGSNHSLAPGSDGNAYAWGSNSYGQLGNTSIRTGGFDSRARSLAPVPVMFNLRPVITGVKFDSDTATGLTRGDDNSVTVTTSAHEPGTVTVSVDYKLGGAGSTLTYNKLQYTYTPAAVSAGVLPHAGGEGILLLFLSGMTGMGGVMASSRHRREQRQLSQALHE